MSSYELEKTVWTENDFSVMGWHDSKIWGFLPETEEFQFMLDLDYIFQWVHPKGKSKYFKFWVSPVTMVFENSYDIILDIESSQGEIEVSDLKMENFRKAPNGIVDVYDFIFECNEGEIKISSSGFKLYVRSAPVLQNNQHLEYRARGGINFGREFKNS